MCYQLWCHKFATCNLQQLRCSQFVRHIRKENKSCDVKNCFAFTASVNPGLRPPPSPKQVGLKRCTLINGSIHYPLPNKKLFRKFYYVSILGHFLFALFWTSRLIWNWWLICKLLIDNVACRSAFHCQKSICEPPFKIKRSNIFKRMWMWYADQEMILFVFRRSLSNLIKVKLVQGS